MTYRNSARFCALRPLHGNSSDPSRPPGECALLSFFYKLGTWCQDKLSPQGLTIELGPDS